MESAQGLDAFTVSTPWHWVWLHQGLTHMQMF
jgi:hypothetical protein